MKISNLFNSGKTVFSFEVFPPKKTSPIESVYGKLEEISALKPDFISVTYSAGGSGSKSRTCEIATKIKRDFGVESVAHLTCINSTKADIDRNLALFKENGIENILALRGDRVEGVEPQKDFTYASDLCRYIASQGDFDIAGACYPGFTARQPMRLRTFTTFAKRLSRVQVILFHSFSLTTPFTIAFLKERRLQA